MFYIPSQTIFCEEKHLWTVTSQLNGRHWCAILTTVNQTCSRNDDFRRINLLSLTMRNEIVYYGTSRFCLFFMLSIRRNRCRRGCKARILSKFKWKQQSPVHTNIGRNGGNVNWYRDNNACHARNTSLSVRTFTGEGVGEWPRPEAQSKGWRIQLHRHRSVVHAKWMGKFSAGF